MALQMAYTAADEVVYPQCYIVISAIVLASSGATVCTNFFSDEIAYLDGTLPVTQPAFQADVALWDQQGNPFDVAYAYLLTLPEFSGAVVVQEN